MGIAKLYGQNGSGGKINGIIEDYYAYAGENISVGDFVEFINGVAGQKTETSVDTAIDNTNVYTGRTISAVALDSSRVFIAHSYGSNYDLYGVVCTINGTNITHGTDILLATSAGYETSTVSSVKINDNTVFIAHSFVTNYRLNALVCLISGTTIEIKAQRAINSTNQTGNPQSVTTIDTNKVLIAHNNNDILYGVVCEFSGTGISVGTDTQLSTSISCQVYVSSTTIINNKVFIVYDGTNSYSLYAMVVTISGTTITAGTETLLSASSYNGYINSVVKLDDTHFFVAHNQSTSHYLYAMICIINNTSITAGTDTALDTQNSSAQRINTVLINPNEVFLTHSHTQNQFYLCARVCKISGTSILQSSRKTLINEAYSAHGVSTVLVNGNIFIAHSYSSNRFLYAQIFGIQNNLPTNQVLVNQYETQVRKATTSDIYGVAKTSGMGAYKVVEYTIPEGESVNAAETREYIVEGDLAHGDIIPKTWTEITAGTSYIANNGTKLTASSYDTNFSASDKGCQSVCDGSSDTWWQSRRNSLPAWTQLEFVNPVKIIKMKTFIAFNTSNNPECKIQASDDGVTWTDLYNLTDQSTLTEITLTKTMYATHYRIYATKAGTTWTPNVYEWQVSEYVEKIPCTGTALQSGTAGDTIQIAVPITDEESTGHKDIIRVYQPYPEKRLVMADGNILTTSNGDVFLLKEAI